MLNTLLPLEFRLVAAVKLLYAYIPYYRCVPAVIPADIKLCTYDKLTPSVEAAPFAMPNNFLLPKLKVPLTDTDPDDVVIIAFVD